MLHTDCPTADFHTVSAGAITAAANVQIRSAERLSLVDNTA
jgi:hypothetical protein